MPREYPFYRPPVPADVVEDGDCNQAVLFGDGDHRADLVRRTHSSPSAHPQFT